ncbi:hypothetical protein ANN_07025 [Periplaneta americana]|uniref:Uncharacterized protein n=1 Tax=Periplaneta americana TaxID=6978 RepID=A0ABQ8TF91_PERAM|nr:hypothetical protein ANN_07025 [Periplaneta americana]
MGARLAAKPGGPGSILGRVIMRCGSAVFRESKVTLEKEAELQKAFPVCPEVECVERSQLATVTPQLGGIMVDYYRVLEVSRNASTAEIKKARSAIACLRLNEAPPINPLINAVQLMSFTVAGQFPGRSQEKPSTRSSYLLAWSPNSPPDFFV